MKVNEKRLLKLAKLLRDNAKNKKGAKFDLGYWGRNEKDVEEVPVDCGTTACAFGLAAISGVFKADGLTFITEKSGDEKGVGIVPQYKDDIAMDAASSFFGITYQAAEYLFDPSNYPDKYLKGAKGEKFVADRITKFVKASKLIDLNAMSD